MKRKSGKAKFITADGFCEIRNICYPPMPTMRFAVKRKLRMPSETDCLGYDASTLETREYRLMGRDDDGCFVYKEEPRP